MRHRILVRVLSVLVMIIGPLVPATAARAGVVTECAWQVTAAGNGQQARHGVTPTAPSAGTMHTGDLEFVLKKSTPVNSAGYSWLPDASVANVWYPLENLGTGTYYLQFYGYCSAINE